MKGLELSHQFFNTYGKPMIKEKFYQYRNRIAVGMAGEGSECLGFDDALSRDHDWGPGFCLWLDDGDFEQIGKTLEAEYNNLPKLFMGFPRITAKLSRKKVGVFRVTDFYYRFIGLPHAPKSNTQWMNLSDEYLCACTNGKIFFDPLGKFLDIRKKLLDFYPEDVRLFKIAAKCMSCAQSGQYNFLRSVRRGELFAAAYAQNTFCSEVICLVFLLNKKFAPFYKWKHRAIRELGNLGEFVYENIAKLFIVNDNLEKKNIMETICSSVIVELRNQEISDSKSDFLLDHGQAVQKKITDKALQGRDVWGA